MGPTIQRILGRKPVRWMRANGRRGLKVPIVRAVSATRNGRVGVICTVATATSRAYDDAFASNPAVELHTRACPRFVELVEAGVTSGPEIEAVAHEYLQPLVDADIDASADGIDGARTRRHGETSVIIELMTPAHGRHLGLVRGGRSRKLQPVLQPGNSVTATSRCSVIRQNSPFFARCFSCRKRLS